MEAQLREPLKPLNTILLCDVRGVSGGFLIGPSSCHGVQETLVSRTVISMVGFAFTFQQTIDWDSRAFQSPIQFNIGYAFVYNIWI